MNDTPQISYSPSVSQAVLDALPEPVLLWTTDNHALRPLNAAAVEWLSSAADHGDSIHFADLFPELNPGDLRNASAGLVFTRAKPAVTDTQEVILRMLQIMPHGDRAGDPQSIAIVVRAVNRGADERATCRATLSTIPSTTGSPVYQTGACFSGDWNAPSSAAFRPIINTRCYSSTWMASSA